MTRGRGAWAAPLPNLPLLFAVYACVCGRSRWFLRCFLRVVPSCAWRVELSRRAACACAAHPLSDGAKLRAVLVLRLRDAVHRALVPTLQRHKRAMALLRSRLRCVSNHPRAVSARGAGALMRPSACSHGLRAESAALLLYFAARATQSFVTSRHVDGVVNPCVIALFGWASLLMETRCAYYGWHESRDRPIGDVGAPRCYGAVRPGCSHELAQAVWYALGAAL